MESVLINVEFHLQPCERCQRPTLHALCDPAAALPSTSLRASGAGNFRICSVCEPAAFERAALSLVLARTHALGVARDKSLAPAGDEDAERQEFLQ